MTPLPPDLVTRCPDCGHLAPVIGGRVVAHYRRGNETPCPFAGAPPGEVLEYAEAARRTFASPDAAAARPAAAPPSSARPDLFDRPAET